MKFLQAAVLFLLCTHTYGQDCSELQDSELGSTDALSSVGLLADVLAAESGDANPSVQIYATNKVCLGQGTLKDTYRTVSIVVLYLRDSDDTNVTAQVEFQCMPGGMWRFAEPSISLAPDAPPNATLTTPVRTDCTICIGPAIAPTSVTISALEHCAVCRIPCVGLMRCTGQFSSQICCNYFDMSQPGTCVETCPADSVPNANTFVCECDPGYEVAAGGTSCQEINECDPNPCQNGGTCTDMVNDFSCACALGFTGSSCMTIINNCDPNPCQNGGTCTDGVDAFSCACVPGFNGSNCMTNIDDCDPNPCQNGGTCTDGVDDFLCACTPGFTGETCSNIIQCDVKDCVMCSEEDVCVKCEDGFKVEGKKCEETPNNVPIIIGVVVGVVGFLLLVMFLIIIIIVIIVTRRNKKQKYKDKKELTDVTSN